MKTSSALRAGLVALTALIGIGLSSAHADSGSVQLTIYKAGWVIGGSGGGGTLNFQGRSYRLSAGGIDYGLVFGGSKTVLRGTSATSIVLRTSRAFTVQRARALRSAAARAPSCSPTRRARCLSCRASRSA